MVWMFEGDRIKPRTDPGFCSRITRTAEGVWVADTVSGRDGTDFLTGVENASFRDVSFLDLPGEGAADIGLDSPLVVEDVITVANRIGSTITYQGKSFANSFLISGTSLTGNDRDWQNDALKITSLKDKSGAAIAPLDIAAATTTAAVIAAAWRNVQGGQAILSSSGDVLFRPDAAYTGVMSFQYTVKDVDGTAAATVTQIGDPDNSGTMHANVYLKTPEMPGDPLLTDQWYLSDTNVIPVWQDYTGKGVRIGQFEPGGPFAVSREVLDYRHADLQANIDAAWLANSTPGQLAGEGSEERFSNHATLVAGVMVAANDAVFGTRRIA